MIVSEQDALNRLNSPLNLMNRLRNHQENSKRRDAMGLFGINNNNNGNKDNNQTPTIRTSFSNPFKKEETALAPIPSQASTPLPSNSPEHPEAKEPELDDLVNNADSQVKLGLAHDEALDTLVQSVKLMKTKLDDIKADKLPSVIAATSKVVDQIQRQRIEANKARGQREVHFHFYTPTQRKVEEYQVIDVG